MRFWSKYALTILSIGAAANLATALLARMAVPVQIPVPLHVQDHRATHEVSGFFAARYQVAVAFDRTEFKSFDLFERLSKGQIRRDLAVDLVVTLRDEEGRVRMRHEGPLNGWRLSNRSPIPGFDGAFYKGRFRAWPWTTYQVELEIVQAAANAADYELLLVYEGLGGQRLWRQRFALNLLLVLVLLPVTLAVVVIRRRRERAARSLALRRESPSQVDRRG